jgi:tetratricopeptide (TPR) repeat protein
MNRSDGRQVREACPSREELSAFNEGRLPEPALSRVAAHIDTPCPQCVAELEDLEDGASPLLADLREPPAVSAAEAEEACRCVLDRVPAPAVATASWLPPLIPTAAVALDDVPPDLPGHKTLPPPVGKGGMGVVWHVQERQFQRPLALKVMQVAASADSRCVRRFLAEARITAQLTHPSIVPVHAMARLADGRPYYTMKLVEGQTLKELLEAGPDTASRRTDLLQVFARVCQALAFAHRKGVIHRDLKPGNVMVGEHGEVQVMDWGVAKVLAESDALPAEAAQPIGAPAESEDTQDGDALGTWPYMPPEQANGRIEEMDRRSDVFGLGAMLCVILTGKPPYVGPTPEDVIRQARAADLAGAFARLEACGADADLVALARDCLSARPSDRPCDASAVEQRLTGYLASVQERLRKAELDKRAAEEKAKVERQARLRMRRLLAGLAASSGLFLLALGVAGFFAWRDHDARWELVQQQHVAELVQQQHVAGTIDKALTAAMGGDLEGAEQAIEKAEQAGASTGQVRMVRGQIALHRAQSQDAMRHLEQAVQLQPESVAARGMLAAAYAYDGQWGQYEKTIRVMEQLSPATAEDFLFKGYAEGNLNPEQGLQGIKKAFELRPKMGVARLLRSEIRAYQAQDRDDLAAAEAAVEDARFARELLGDNPAALWISLNAHLTKAGVHEHRAEPERRRAELDLAGKYADALKPFTQLPEAVVHRWLYFREVDREEEVLEELRRASDQTDHVYVAFCYALTLYRRGDFEEALRVLEKKRGTYDDRLRPFVLAEHDYLDKQDWPKRAREASEYCAARAPNGMALMHPQSVLCLLGKKEEAVRASEEAVRASKALQEQPERFYTLRRDPMLRCLDYHAGKMPADELVQAARGSRWDQCLAHYAIGLTKLAEGDRKAAFEQFDKVVKTRAFLWGAYDLSWVFRDRLAKDPTWPPWIPAGRAK